MRYGKYIIGCVILALLSGCGASVGVVKNDKVDFKKQKFANAELYLVGPKKDPRKVIPVVAKRFEDLGFHVHVVAPGKPVEGAQGTGFVIAGGYIVTCAHVITDNKDATVWANGKRYEADVVEKDKKKDIALLKVRKPADFHLKPVSFRTNGKYTLGEEVYTVGYPISSILGNSARMSQGLVSSVVGMKDNKNYLQISADVQPGNSGGPVFDKNGQVVGVVASTLNPLSLMAHGEQALPQNVNFAIKANVLLDYLKSDKKINYKELIKHRRSSAGSVAQSIVKVKGGIIPVALELRPRLLARLFYVPMWDMMPSFALFEIHFYDLREEKFLFAAGQKIHVPLSSEKSVEDGTFKEIEETLGIAPPKN